MLFLIDGLGAGGWEGLGDGMGKRHFFLKNGYEKNGKNEKKIERK